MSIWIKKSSRRLALSVSLVTCLGTLAGVSQSWAFSSKDGIEVDLEYDGKVALPSPSLVPAKDGVPAHPETLTSDEQVQLQLTFLSGAFQNNPVQGGRRTDDTAVITREDKNFIYYHYKGKALLDNKVGNHYPFTLPRDPKTVYQASVNPDGKVPCTDPHYQGAGDYFYFWNPTARGCRLQKERDYFEITADVKRLPDAPQTFPDYSRLIDKNGEITIHVLMGKNEDKTTRKPVFSFDDSAPTFKQYDALLKKEKFSAKTLSKNEILHMMAVQPEGKEVYYKKLPYIREYEKTEGGVKVKIRYFYGNVSAADDSGPMHFFWKDAIEHASVAIYSGHSGLGWNLKPEMIQEELGEFNVDPYRYQIWVLDGCSTYTYYQQPYFQVKASKMTDKDKLDRLDPKANLQIISAALESGITYNAATPLEMTTAILAYLRHKDAPNWKTLAGRMSHENLIAVSGDEMAPDTVDGRYIRNIEMVAPIEPTLIVPPLKTTLPVQLTPLVLAPAPVGEIPLDAEDLEEIKKMQEEDAATGATDDAPAQDTPSEEAAPAEAHSPGIHSLGDYVPEFAKRYFK
ncbi:MAG: hypothetical protein H7222_00200 [Methylotenera sp.]|nr:hypothetical protein [Oligoflexia bacterium]